MEFMRLYRVGALSILVCAWALAAGCVSRPPLPAAKMGGTSRAGAPIAQPPPRPALPPMPEPVEPAAPSLSPEELEAEFRLNMARQILLDRQNFSCGCADGVVGEKTRTALRAWQRQKSLPATGVFDEETMARLGDPASVFFQYTVVTQDLESLAAVPSTWLEKSMMSALVYGTVLEALAERFHVTQNSLRRLNPGADWPDPPVGTVITAPNPAGKRAPRAERIRISLGRKTIQVYDAKGQMIALFPCSIAKDKAKRPSGVLKVAACAEKPTYMFDPKVFSEDPEAQRLGKRLWIPPGPNNPVGVAWIGLDRPGYGIHGTPSPEDIGKTESHGCFRLANWNAQKLIKMVHTGIPVLIEE